MQKWANYIEGERLKGRALPRYWWHPRRNDIDLRGFLAEAKS